MEGLRGKEALVQVVVKNIARKEVKEPETRSDDELRVALRAQGDKTVKVGFVLAVRSCCCCCCCYLVLTQRCCC